MAKERRKFERYSQALPYGKQFLIVTEGKKTEPAYFNLFNEMEKNLAVFVRCLTSKHSAPNAVLECMQSHLKEKGSIKATDEAWLVVDKDSWNKEQLNALYEWSKQKNNYHLALSNPKFEYWLLFHFEKGVNITSDHQLKKRLAEHMPNYDKTINNRKMTIEKIRSAVERAKQRDHPPCEKWPQEKWQTTVYKLVDNILQQEIKT